MNIEIDWHIKHSAFAQRIYACLVNLSRDTQITVNDVLIKRSGNRGSRNFDEMSIIFHAAKGTYMSAEIVFHFIEMLGKAGIYLFEREQDENFTNVTLYVLCPELGFKDVDKWEDMEYLLSLFKSVRDSEDLGDTTYIENTNKEIDKLLPRHPRSAIESK